MYQATTPCPTCGAQNLQGTWTCAYCGNTLLVYCPNCRAANVSGNIYCQYCSSPLSGQAPPPGQSPQPAQQAQPYYQQPPPGYQQPPYGQYDYQQPPPGYQQPPYGQYDYQQYPGGYPTDYPPPAPPNDIIGKVQVFFDTFPGKLKQIVSTTNPILLSAMVVLIVGMAVFLVLAFQLGWIKTGTAPKTTTAVTDKTPPTIYGIDIQEGANKGVIISWITDEPSSSQVQYGVFPNFTTFTPVKDDPTTGVNTGALKHDVGLTNLIPRSTYQYRCISMDKYGNKAISGDLTFQTTN